MSAFVFRRSLNCFRLLLFSNAFERWPCTNTPAHLNFAVSHERGSHQPPECGRQAVQPVDAGEALALPGAPHPSRPAPARRRHPTHACELALALVWVLTASLHLPRRRCEQRRGAACKVLDSTATTCRRRSSASRCTHRRPHRRWSRSRRPLGHRVLQSSLMKAGLTLPQGRQPLHVASSRCVSVAEAAFAVAQNLRIVPLVVV